MWQSHAYQNTAITIFQYQQAVKLFL